MSTREKTGNGTDMLKKHHWLSPVYHTLTPEHGNVYGRYQVVRTIVDFSAACCFVIGSVLFLSPNAGSASGVFFIVGSVLFAVKPTLDLIRALHLRKM